MRQYPVARRGEAKYRALADPNRRHLLRLIEDAEGPVEVAELARRIGLHPNTVRDHLELLEEAGLVERTTEERSRPGRPKVLYRPGPRETRAPGSEGYKFLAEVLASWIQGSADRPAAAAEEAGRVWGRQLVDHPSPFAAVDAAAATEEVVTVLAQLGFGPEESDCDGSTVVELHDCPFRDIAHSWGDVVCSVHLGLLRGVAEESGGAVSIDSLEPFVEPSLCRVRLSRRDGDEL